jgi:hypothetical protein
MALFDNNRRNGIQMGTVGDECMECKRKHRDDEDYIPESLDYKDVYKFWINNLSHCICLNCFKESLGKYILMDPAELESEKPKKNTNKKKEEDKDGGKTTKSSERK